VVPTLCREEFACDELSPRCRVWSLALSCRALAVALLTLFSVFSLKWPALPDASAQVGTVVATGVAGAVTAPSADVPRAEDWPQWRGPGRDGIAAATPVWPADLGEETLVEQWRRPFGPSYSGPLVVGERLFTTETRNGQQEAVTALDRRTGEVLWEAEWEGAMQVPFFAAANGSWIRATPACDGERVYAAGMRDVLVCLAVEDGQELWKVDFMEKYGTPLPAFGFASSPLLFGDALYVQAAASIVKLDKRTGDVLWRTADTTQREMDSAFSSPIIARLHNREILVVQARDALKGLDPATGDVLWSQNIQAFQGMNILTPTVYENALLTSAHSGRTQFWRVPEPDFPEAGLEEAWSLPMQAYMSSPVVIGEHAYLHLRKRSTICSSRRSRSAARGAAVPRDAALRRAADRRHGPAQRRDRRDGHRRRQDAGRHAAGVPQRAGGQGRARRHGQRLPGPPRHGVDGAALHGLGLTVGAIQAGMDVRRAAEGLRLRHHLRHEQRVRLRLPPRQHAPAAAATTAFPSRCSSARAAELTRSSTKSTTS
jgi:outer membrane protein assembly factor BamB